MIRALREGVPQATLEFFRDPDPAKDLDRYWRELQDWFFDPERGLWHAGWSSFQFPQRDVQGLGGPYTFVGATFAPGADFTRVRFHSDGSFYWARFLGEVDFTEAVFGSADFNGVRFRGPAWFWRARFEGGPASTSRSSPTRRTSPNLASETKLGSDQPNLRAV